MLAAETVTQSQHNDDVIAVKEPATRRYSTTQEQQELDEKLRRLQRSSLSRRSSAVQSPLLEAVIARITQSFSSSSELVSIEVWLYRVVGPWTNNPKSIHCYLFFGMIYDLGLC